MGSKRPINSFKVAKTCICKNLEKPAVFHGFWASKAVQDSLGRPKKAPNRRLMSSKGLKKVDPNYSPNGTNFDNFLDHFWGTFGVHFGAKIGSRRGPKVEPLLEPLGAASQGSGSCVFRNYTRGVERLLELQLYSPKERERNRDI